MREWTQAEEDRFDGLHSSDVIDELLEAEEIIKYYADVLRIRCRMKKHDDGKKARDYVEKKIG